MTGHFKRYLLLLALLSGSQITFAQLNSPSIGTQPGGLNRAPKDTSKSNTNQWKDDAVSITYEKLNSARTYTPDTQLHTFHRRHFTQPWFRDLGNLGSPTGNLLFTPEYRVGPTLGYHVNDVYRYDVDSLNFYNTTRPYSTFSYMLGSKLEQVVSIMHSQNIRPNWNFAVEYRKINSPGFYKIQRNNHDNAYFSTTYKSLNKHYTLNAGMVFNKEQHDENGGMTDDSQLANPQYSDRKTMQVAFVNDGYSTTRSSVTNLQRDFTVLLQHAYTWGKSDTTYSEDSTQFAYKLKPLFSISHKMEISTEKHEYKDVTPDSLRYVSLFQQSFISNGSGYYALGGDSVVTQQKWFWADNKLMLNGFLGREGRQLKFSAGLGNRFDQFISVPVSNLNPDSLPKRVYMLGYERNTMISNYLAGEIKKEALHAGAWEYGANTKFFFTGPYAGNFILHGAIGKELRNILGSIVAGFQQQLNSAPYSYTNYANAYAELSYRFNKESVTTLYGTFESPRFRVSGGVRHHIINNYIYIDSIRRLPSQYAATFNLSQIWLRKVIKMGSFIIDNELVVQKPWQYAPVNIPELLGRHQFSYESAMFKKALKIATGIEIRYNSKYHPAGYDAVLNRFYYQTERYIENIPQASVFINFRIKRFRAFLMGDNMQQLFNKNNTILYTAAPIGGTIPTYAAPDFVIRFGFSWPLVN